MRTWASNSVAVYCALALTLVLGVAACGDDSSASKTNGAGDTYEPTRRDLERLGNELFAAIAAEDVSRAEAIAESLRLPDHQAWFADHFGDDNAARLTAEYEPSARALTQLVVLFGELAENGQTEIAAERFDEVGDSASVGYQRIAMEAMKNKTPLYSMRIRKPGADDVFHLWSFVHDDGFRWVGKLRSLSRKTPADPDLLEYRIRDVDRAARAHDTKSAPEQ